MDINKESYEMIDMAPLLGVGTGMVILMAYVNKMYKKRIKSTKKIIEDNKRIFFISKEGEYDKQREEQKYFNSINTLTPQEPMSKQFEHLLKGDGKYSLADVLAGVFAPPLQKIPNPLNFIEISLEKSGPFKYSYYPSNNRYLSKSRGLCLLMNDSNLESDYLDNYYPEWNSATYKKNIQTNKPITPTYNFNMIVTRRGCFGNVWKNFRNIEEVYKKIQLENHFLQQKNDRNEEDRKNLITNHQNQINEISLKFQQEKESFLQQLKTVQLYLDGERNLRIEKEKEIEIYNMEIQKLNQKIKQYELLSSYNNNKLNGSGSSNGFLNSHN